MAWSPALSFREISLIGKLDVRTLPEESQVLHSIVTVFSGISELDKGWKPFAHLKMLLLLFICKKSRDLSWWCFSVTIVIGSDNLSSTVTYSNPRRNFGNHSLDLGRGWWVSFFKVSSFTASCRRSLAVSCSDVVILKREMIVWSESGWESILDTPHPQRPESRPPPFVIQPAKTKFLLIYDATS